MARTLTPQVIRGRQIWLVKEHTPSEIPISVLLEDGRLNVYDEVLSGDYFDIRLEGDRLLISARGYIGLVPLNDQVGVLIEPRVSIGNLSRVLEVSGYTPIPLEPFRRGYEVDDSTPPELLPVLAHGFLDAVDEVVTRGLFQSYQNVREDTSFPRGRILIGQTLKKHQARGQNQRTAVSRYERSENTAPNRLLKYALWFLAQLFRGMEPRGGVQALQARLNQRFQNFRNVELDHGREFLASRYVQEPEELPPVRDYYIPAIRLARLLVTRGGIRIDSTHGNVLIASLLIKMSDAFEKYVREVLREGLGDGTNLHVLDGNIRGDQGGKRSLFNERDKPSATPDIVIESADEAGEGQAVRAVIEVKYRPKSGLPSRPAINQVTTYATRYASPSATVVNLTEPGENSGLHEIGTIGGITFSRYGYSLSGDLASEDQKFCEAIRKTLDPMNGSDDGSSDIS